MGIFKAIKKFIGQIIFSIIWLRRVEINYSGLKELAEMINRCFIIDASDEDIALLKTVLKCNLSSGIFLGSAISTRDDKYTLHVGKYRKFFIFIKYYVYIYDDTVYGKRTLYTNYKGFSDDEFLNYIDSFLHPKEKEALPKENSDDENKSAESKIRCNQCDLEFNSSIKFCPNCGAKNENRDGKNADGVSKYKRPFFVPSVLCIVNIIAKYVIFFAIIGFILLIISSIVYEIKEQQRKEYYDDLFSNVRPSYYDYDDYDDYNDNTDTDNDTDDNTDYDYNGDYAVTDDYYGEDKINSVKNAVNSNYPNTTYGEAFDSFFASPNWEYFVGSLEGSNEEDDVVEFTGSCTSNGTAGDVIIQFTLYEDDTFEITYFSFDNIAQNRTELNSLLEAVFNNTLDSQDQDSSNTAVSDDYKNAYIDYISGMVSDESKQHSGHHKYAFIYIDNDEIPELYVGGTCEAEGDKICVYNNGSVTGYHLHRTGGMSYIEREGMVCNFNGQETILTVQIYSLSNGVLTELNTGGYIEAVLNEYTDNYEDTYYWNDISVSESEFYANWNSVFDTSRAKEVTYTYTAEEAISYINSNL